MAIAETREVGGVSYPVEVINAFMKAKGKTDELDFPSYWLEQHLITFNEGWQAAMEGVPNCDDCEERMPDEPCATRMDK